MTPSSRARCRGWACKASNVIGVVPTSDGNGYLMIGSDGGTFAFGDAKFEGSLPGMGVKVSNIIGVVPSYDGAGYLMIGSDGGTFAFGDAKFEGSLPGMGDQGQRHCGCHLHLSEFDRGAVLHRVTT